jgi:hypothetical protein
VRIGSITNAPAGWALLCAPVLVSSVSTSAQGNYEIQVYGSDTVAPGRTMLELHSNFTFEGFKTSGQGVLPDEHQLHETVEITQGWTEWFETGFYIFTSYGPGQGYTWVGDHIPAARSSSGEMALAGWGEPFDRTRLPAAYLFRRYLDLRDSPHRRQTVEVLVPCLQSRLGAVLSRAKRIRRRGFFSQLQGCLLDHAEVEWRARILRIVRTGHGL